MKQENINFYMMLNGLKFLCLTYFLILNPLMSVAQININELERTTDKWTKKGEEKPYSGDFVEYYDNGTIKGTGTFKDGLVHGSRMMYNENGKIYLKRNYANGINDGASIEYYNNGNVKQEAYFKNGKEDGKLKIFYENGQLKALFTLLDGVQEGDYYEYDSNGKLIAQYFYVNGKAGYEPEFIELTKKALELSKEFKNDEAIKLYDKAMKLNPTVAQLYFNRGACKANNFDFDGAIIDYDMAIAIAPDYMEAYGNRGNAKINKLTSKGNIKPSAEQTQSACDDFYKSKTLGDSSVGTLDMIYIYCTKK